MSNTTQREPRVLCLSSYGCEEVTRPALSGIVLPPATDTYCPIGHDYLLDIVEDSLADVGFRFGPQHHGLSHDGKRYFGVIELVGASENADFTLQVGLRNSLDKRFPAGVAFGNLVRVCANLSFWGEQSFNRKHTVNVMRDLPGLVLAAVSNTRAMAHNQELRFERYQEVPLKDRYADHLIVQMLRAGVINTQRVEKVVQEWDEPSEEHGPRTVWRLFNAVTETLKGVNIHEMPRRTIELQALMDGAANFVPVALAA